MTKLITSDDTIKQGMLNAKSVYPPHFLGDSPQKGTFTYAQERVPGA